MKEEKTTQYNPAKEFTQSINNNTLDRMSLIQLKKILKMLKDVK